MKKIDKEITLTGAEIDAVSEEISDFLNDRKTDKKEAMKLKFSIENVLISWRDELGESTKVSILSKRRFGKEEILVQCAGAECNPLFESVDELGSWAGRLQASLESVPTFDYLRKTNNVTFPICKKKINRLYLVLFFLLAGVLIGFAGNLLSPDVRTAVCDRFFTPFYDSYLTLMSFCGIPLIFLSVVTGVLGVESLHTFTKIGKGMVIRFLLILVAVAAVAIGITLPFFPLNFSTGGAGFSYGDFLSLILSWVPSGVFQPFINSDAIQLIVTGLMFSITLLTLKGCSGSFVSMLGDVNSVFLEMFAWMTNFIPFFISVMVIKSMWSSEVSMLLEAWKPWVLTTGMQLLFVLVVLVFLSVRYRASILTLTKKIMKTFLIALGTNSCTASIKENYSCCDSLGIDGKVYSFGIPIGTTCFKPATVIRLVALCFFAASVNGVPVSVGWILMLFVLAIVFSVAIPAIPGGTLMFCTMIFSQLDLPTAAVAQVLATDIFFDCICTAVNQISVELVLTSHAGFIGYLDEEKIR